MGTLTAASGGKLQQGSSDCSNHTNSCLVKDLGEGQVTFFFFKHTEIQIRAKASENSPQRHRAVMNLSSVLSTAELLTTFELKVKAKQFPPELRVSVTHCVARRYVITRHVFYQRHMLFNSETSVVLF